MNIRQRRLEVDYQKMLTLQSRSPFVHILETKGKPPEEYLLQLTYRGIACLNHGGMPQYSEDHRLQVKLPANYPAIIPDFRLLTPLWHPNVNEQIICMGHEGERGYVPSMGLDDLIIRIVQIIGFANYSREYALNRAAFQWAAENAHLFPVDNRQIVLEEIQINIIDDAGKPDRKLLDEINIF